MMHGNRIVLAMWTLMMWFSNAVLHCTALMDGDRFALAMGILTMQSANATPHCATNCPAVR
jgi:hypothetical protein